MGASGNRAAGIWAAPALFCLIWFAVAFWAASALMHHGPGALFDSDCYMRLIRARALWECGEHPFRGYAESNFPVGETTTWTLPMDLAIGLAAAPLRPCGMSWKAALFEAGYWISPALFLLSGAMFLLALRAAGGARAAVAGAILLPLSQAVINMFFPGRPDHHGLLHVCWCAAVLSTAAWIRNPDRMRFLHWGAVAAALMFWISVEGSYLAATLLALLGMNTVLRGDPPARAVAFSGMARFAAWLTAASFLSAWVERGGPLSPEYWEWDRISLRHASGLGSATLLLLAARRAWISKTPALRLLAGAAAGAIGLVVYLATAPLGPEWLRGRGPREMLDFLILSTSDNQAVYAMDQGLLPSLLLWYGAPLAIWPLATWRWLRCAPHPPPVRWFAAGIAFAYVPMGFQISRWNLYGSTCLAFFAAWWIAAVAGDWERRRRHTAGAGSAREALWLLLFLAAGCAWAGRIGWTWTSDRIGGGPARGAVDAAIIRLREAWRADAERCGVASRQVLAPIAWGPSLMYLWDARVLGTPYYRNAAGMERTFAWFRSSDQASALAAIRAGGWFYAVVPSGELPAEIADYQRYIDTRAPRTGRERDTEKPPETARGNMLVDSLCGPREMLPEGVRWIAEVPIDGSTNRAVRLVRLGASQ